MSLAVTALLKWDPLKKCCNSSSIIGTQCRSWRLQLCAQSNSARIFERTMVNLQPVGFWTSFRRKWHDCQAERQTVYHRTNLVKLLIPQTQKVRSQYVQESRWIIYNQAKICSLRTLLEIKKLILKASSNMELCALIFQLKKVLNFNLSFWSSD